MSLKSWIWNNVLNSSALISRLHCFALYLVSTGIIVVIMLVQYTVVMFFLLFTICF